MSSVTARRRIVAYVEAYDDVLFWRTVLASHEDDSRYFEVMLPSHNDTLKRGKRSALLPLLQRSVGQDMIACVDADYDYLMQGATDTSRIIARNPYVLHTYAYSIENLQCYAPSLRNVCVMATLNDRNIFDFVAFLRRYSEAVFPLFVWSVWCYRNNHYDKFSLTDFNNIIDIGNFDFAGMRMPQGTTQANGTSQGTCRANAKPQGMERFFAQLQGSVGRKIGWLRKNIPQGSDECQALECELAALERELLALGVTPQDTYLYIQGHHLFDRVVAPLLRNVCGRLVREREAEIRSQAVHAKQQNNELACYRHSIQDVALMLKRNFGYCASPLLQRIHADIERLLQ